MGRNHILVFDFNLIVTKMPGHDHVFREYLPPRGIDNRDTLLLWACPVKGDEFDISRTITKWCLFS